MRLLLALLLLNISALGAYAGTINEVVLVDDFDRATTENVLGGVTQGDELNVEGRCIPSFAEDPATVWGRAGASLQLEYDVTFPGSFSFYTTHFGPPQAGDTSAHTTKDLSAFNYVSFWYKTNASSIMFTIEMHKDADSDGKFILGKDPSSKVALGKYLRKQAPGVWHKVVIPFTEFPLLSSWTNMYEMVFVFEQALHCGKGTVYIDDIVVGSNYPTTEQEAMPFPGRLQLNLCMVNGAKAGNGFMLQERTTFDLLVKNIHPALECIRIETSNDGMQHWSTVCSFYEHATGMYTGEMVLTERGSHHYFLRVVAVDIFGREATLAGPFEGISAP